MRYSNRRIPPQGGEKGINMIEPISLILGILIGVLIRSWAIWIISHVEGR
jgi:hypothetical protein